VSTRPIAEFADGEWGGSVLMSMEWGSQHRRGLVASWPQFGVPAGLLLASLVGHHMQYGPQAALIAESFPGSLRYSGASIGYQLASIFAGGPAPLIATVLYGQYKSGTSVAVYIAICAVITLGAVALMRERSRVDIATEYGDVDASAPRVARAPAS
jgi:hypothetical protein